MYKRFVSITVRGVAVAGRSLVRTEEAATIRNIVIVPGAFADRRAAACQTTQAAKKRSRPAQCWLR
jgi:hypothetical protein